MTVVTVVAVVTVGTVVTVVSSDTNHATSPHTKNQTNFFLNHELPSYLTTYVAVVTVVTVLTVVSIENVTHPLFKKNHATSPICIFKKFLQFSVLKRAT